MMFWDSALANILAKHQQFRGLTIPESAADCSPLDWARSFSSHSKVGQFRHVVEQEAIRLHDEHNRAEALASREATWNAHPAVVYFIVADDAPGFVKIGHAINPEKRMRSFACGHPTAEWTLIATMPGGPEREGYLHLLFDAHRHRGEWFRLVPEIEGFIATIKFPNDPERLQKANAYLEGIYVEKFSGAA